jgi:sedoheptulokinase
MNICSLTKPIIHISDAASFGLFDLSTKTFESGFGVDFVENYKIAGKYGNIPVSVAIGDNQASILSSVSDQNDLLINVGTGSQVSVITDNIVSAPNIETRPFFEDKYICVGSGLCGGRAYAMLKDFYKSLLSRVTDADDKTVYDIMNSLIEEGTETLKVDTRFAGTRADNTVRGGIYGISTVNFTPSALTRGVIEGMIDELYGMYASMGVTIKGIAGSGNGIRKNKALIKAAEKSFGYTMKIPCHTEEAAFGAALYGVISAGYRKNMSEIGKMIRFEVQ